MQSYPHIQQQFSHGMHACIDALRTYYRSPPIDTLVLGISGGIDSMVMAHLMHHWAKQHPIKCTAVVINHSLRHNSMDEAKWTQSTLQHMGIHTKIITNTAPKPTHGIQAYARDIRYTLLNKVCHDIHAPAVCVAHHYQDCLETVAIREQQGSTPYGLSAMNMVHKTPDGIICRPMLNIKKPHIIQYANDYDIPYVNDPSNENMDFTRVRMRHRMTTDSIFTKHLQTIYSESVAFRRNIDTVIGDFLKKHVHAVYGAVKIDTPALLCETVLHAQYILRHLLMWVSGDYTPPRTQKIQNLYHAIRTEKPATLHGCYIRSLQKSLWIWREPYDICTQNRFMHTQGHIVLLYGNCPADLIDKVGDTFNQIPKLVQKTLPVRIYQGCIFSLEGKNMIKYDKNAILFMPPPFIL